MSNGVHNPHDAFFKSYLNQPSGLAMVSALLRYIARAAKTIDEVTRLIDSSSAN